MARIEWVERRLLEWAEAVTVGDATGYPSVSVIHPNWSPPAPGVRPALKVGRKVRDVSATHRAIGRLGPKLQAAIVVHYCKRGSIERQCAELECQPATLYQRIDTAHQGIARLLREDLCDIERMV